jgi:hypothetical protein
MGESMGPLEYLTTDYRVSTILSCYAEEDFLPPSNRYLMIGFESDKMMPLHVFYDLETPAREDALVFRRNAAGGDVHIQSETLREWLLRGAFDNYRIAMMQQRCRGDFADDREEVFARLDPLMARLGFTTVAATGPFVRIYDREDACMSCSATPRRTGLGKYRFFHLGGRDADLLRRLLATIATECGFTVTVSDWVPRLA